MIQKALLTILIGTCAVVCVAKPMDYNDDNEDDLSWNEFAKMLSDMPKDEKYRFVKEHVLKGYELAQQDINYEKLNENLKLSWAILNLLKEVSYNTEDPEDNRNSVGNTDEIICFPEPIGCIDASDAVIRPF